MSRLVDLGGGVWVDPDHVISVSDGSADWVGSSPVTVVAMPEQFFNIGRPVGDVLVAMDVLSGGAMVAELDQVARAAWRLADCPHPDHHEQLSTALDALEATGWQPPTKEGAEQ